MDTIISNPTRAKHSDLVPATYSLAEFARLYGCGYTVAHGLAQRGALPVTPLRLGRAYRLPKSEVDAYLKIAADSEPRDAA